MQDFDAFENRELILEADAQELQRQGVLAMDPERALPRWFDGRYLTARDLTREQNYFLSRQSAIGKAIGRGVVEGLEVEVDPGANAERSRIVIGAGQGIAFDGAHLILPEDLTVNLADITVQDNINARLGLSANPGAPIRQRTGLFVLSLRAVEYTANETSAFPTTVTGERTTHKGDRIEAVAVTATQYGPVDVPFDSAEARAMAEQRIFQSEEDAGLPGHALPLAMLSLRNGAIEWVDMHLVRRELVASKRNLLGLGLSRDQLRLAHFHQYRTALADVVASYRDRGQAPRFNADQHFNVLPPAGQIPAAAIDPAAQTQLFFPGEIEVELSIIPEDELPALIDDSFELPPIDLSRPPDERDSLSVMVLAPLPWHVLRSQITQLGRLTRPLKPISMLGHGRQKPIDRLGAMRISLADVAAARRALAEPATQAWATLIRSLASFGTAGDDGAPMLWYVRRRTLAHDANLESALAIVGHVDSADDGEILDPDAPVEPDPGDGTSTPPAPDPLSPEARDTLLRISGLGELARIVEMQMLRVNDNVRAVYLEGLNHDAIAKKPLAITALTARISVLPSNQTNNAKKAVDAVAGANPFGMELLGTGLLGKTNVEVSEKRVEQLLFFTTTKDLLEQAATAAAKLKPEASAKLITELVKAVDTGSDDAVTEIVKAMVEAAKNPTQPSGGGRPPTGGTPSAEPFLETVADQDLKKAMSQLLKTADPAARNALVKQLTKAGAGGSRIAISAVLSRLQSSFGFRVEDLASIKIVDKEFVDGLKQVEPLLIDASSPTARPPFGDSGNPVFTPGDLTGRDLLLRPGALDRRLRPDGTDLSAILGNTTRTPQQKRLALLSTSPALPTLSAFGRKSNAAQRKAGAAKIVAVLDAANANAASVGAVIVEVFKEL